MFGGDNMFPVDLMEVRIINHKERYGVKGGSMKEIQQYRKLEMKLRMYLLHVNKVADCELLKNELSSPKKVCVHFSSIFYITYCCSSSRRTVAVRCC